MEVRQTKLENAMKFLSKMAGAIVGSSFVRPVAEKFVYNFLREKTQGTKNPYDDMVLNVIWKFVTGDMNIEETLRVFVGRMANKQGGIWKHLQAAFDSYYTNDVSKPS